MIDAKLIHSGRAARVLAMLGGALILASFGCGLVSKDVPVTAQFQIGGFPPNSLTSLDATQITTPLEASAGDISKLSSITMTSAVLSSTDGMDLSFITGGTITLTGNGLSTVELAKLSPPGVVGKTSFTIETETDLKAYLEGGGAITVTIGYAEPAPVPARGLQLTLNIHATL